MPKKNFNHQLATTSSFPTWRTFVKSGAIFATVSSLLLFTTSCGSNTQEMEEVQETVMVEKPTQGIITKAKEVSPGKFLVEDEEITPNPEDSHALITYLDGTQKKLTANEVKAMLSPQDTMAMHDTIHHIAETPAATTDSNNTGGQTVKQQGNTTIVTDANGNQTVVVNNTQPAYHSGYNSGLHTLGYVLMGSALGYYMGKSLMTPPNPNIYRNPTPYTTAARGAYGTNATAGRTYSSLRSTAKATPVTRTSYRAVSGGKSGFGSKGSTATSSSSSGRSSGFSG